MGLTEKAAAKRLRRDGPNRFRDEPRHSIVREIARRFRNPLVVLLLVASAISGATGEFASFAIIIAMVLLSVTLDFFQEHRANRAAERLRQSVLVRAKVLRDGVWREMPVATVVRGDVVKIGAGDLVPADGRLIEAAHLYVNQSLLTGESWPVEKNSDDVTPATLSATLESAANTVCMGTTVVSGSATVLVCSVGENTAIGEVATSIEVEPQPTSFEIGTRRFGMLIMRLTFFMVVFVLFANAITHKPWLDSLLFAIALAVGLTPELLPMIVSVTLSRGAMQMAKHDVIVKRLSAIEDLGAMDVLCTDKTGTLTAAKIRLERHLDFSGAESARTLELGYLNSFFETGVKTPMDEAILAHEHIDLSAWKKLDEVPFDFERRRVSVLVESDAGRQLVVKGAPEDLLRLCTHYEDIAAVRQPLDAASRQAAIARCDALGEDGFRVLAVAWKSFARDHPNARADDETELVFAGFLAFLDPPKESAAQAMRQLVASGVAVKVITGDSESVTRHVCTTLGIPIEGLLTGSELGAMDDGALDARVPTVNLFCRVNPAQKKRIVESLKRRGYVTGFLGDGINDAPALHAADVGLSVDGAVDVAKEAADMILLKQDLAVMHEGVMEGRRTFANIRKYIMMGTSSNFGNMFSMAGASLFLPFLAMLPTQILLNNILYDLSEVAIPLDRIDDIEIASPQRWDMGFIRNFMLVIGPVSSLFDFLTFYLLLKVLHANEAMFQTGWFVESLATQVLVIFVIRTRFFPLAANASRPSRALVVTAFAIVAFAMMIPFTVIGSYFGFVHLPLEVFAVLAMLVLIYLVLVEIAKRLFYRFALSSKSE